VLSGVPSTRRLQWAPWRKYTCIRKALLQRESQCHDHNEFTGHESTMYIQKVSDTKHWRCCASIPGMFSCTTATKIKTVVTSGGRLGWWQKS
jgi:hypothetical protein